MALPLNSTQMITALRNEGLQPDGRLGWVTNNRNHKGPWGPVNGVVIHHTAGTGAGMREYVFNGSGELPGPLCHAFLSKVGQLYLIGNGRTNHAGTFAQNAHDAVVEERSVHPRPDAAEPVDGNRHYYGLEIENEGDGRDPYPREQYDAAVRWATAICRAHSWSAESVIGHGEGTRRKVDPSFDMDAFRRAVATRLKGVPAKPDREPAPNPGGSAMRYTALTMTQPLEIPPGASKTLAWDGEAQDGPDAHEPGSKAILEGGVYTGTVSLLFGDRVPAGLQVQMVQELHDGKTSGEPVTMPVAGPIQQSVSVTGRVPAGRRLVFTVHNDSGEPVRLAWAGVRLVSWSV